MRREKLQKGRQREPWGLGHDAHEMGKFWSREQLDVGGPQAGVGLERLQAEAELCEGAGLWMEATQH